MKQQVTVKFNIGMTLVLILYATLNYPAMETTGTVPIETILKETPGLGIGIVIICIPFSLMVFMHALRTLWNRLFPKICGWGEINLAEAYAIGLLIALFGIGL